MASGPRLNLKSKTKANLGQGSALHQGAFDPGITATHVFLHHRQGKPGTRTTGNPTEQSTQQIQVSTILKILVDRIF